MRIMIPASGGLDSTTLLWETLANTGHEVVAVHLDETWLPARSAARETVARRAFDDDVAWLRRETREFRAEAGRVVTADSAGEPYPAGDVPVRAGFDFRVDRRWHRRIFASFGWNAANVGAEEAHIALNTWNRRRGREWLTTEQADFRDHAGGEIAMRFPWLADSGGVWSGRSRLGNLRRIPAALHALTMQCQTGGAGGCDRCVSCVSRAFHDAVCAGLDDAAFARVEARIEEKAHFGPHMATADPATYHPRIVDEAIRDHDEWKAWLAAANGSENGA